MKQGDFVWYELCTTDPVAAADFYSKVVGWTVGPSDLPGIDYQVACLGDRQIAGIMTLPPAQRPPRPVWFGYVAVDDVDSKARDIEAAGGRVDKAPADIPSIGRFAVVSDPQGATFMLFKGTGEAPPPLPMMQTGSIGWHELHSSDWEASWPFYERMLGWTRDAVLDMGPMGGYALFKAGSMPIGGMLTDRQSPHPHWLYYFAVDGIDEAVGRVQAHGGLVLSGPQEVPGGAWVINARDPQGGAFALVELRKAGVGSP